jgi:MFS family permease
MARSASPDAPVSPGAAFRHPDFRLYLVARFLLAVGIQMQSVAIGWHVYSLTQNPLDLGYVGLAQFLPSIGFSLFTGHAADRFDRRRLLMVCYAGVAVSSVLLWWLTRIQGAPLIAIYAVLVLLGTARAFAGPVSQALVTHLVPSPLLTNAVTWNSVVFQGATIAGPAAGGLLYGWVKGAPPVFATCAVIDVAALAMLTAMRVRTGRMEPKAISWQQLLAGVRYVWEKKVILASISLDLFAVLLGGAVALLPVFTRDVLGAGPGALGLLRSGPAMGAGFTALLLAWRPIRRRAGVAMLACVGIFGLATVGFGLSRSIALSLVFLAITGAADMVSVVIRLTLVQIATPASMRGRVSAVNTVFINASNELGEFESGVTAAWLGAVPAVVIGGVGTCAVVALWAWLFPQLRQIDRLDDAAIPEARSPTAAEGHLET